jgi:3-oxoadipate enol-lactonase
VIANVNGTQLYYERSGAGAPIVFIHGATLDRRMWQPQIAALAKDHDAVAYDVRGYGRSAMPDETVAFRHYEDAAALIEHLGLARAGVTVVGHSIGALWALELALARPDLVAACALVCMSGLRPYPDDLTAMFAGIRSAPSVAAAKAIWRACGWLASTHELPELDAMLADYTGWYWTHASPSRNLDPPAVTRLEQLAIPVVVVEGARDLAYNHAVARELVERIPRATLVTLATAGHMANLEEPTAVTRAIAELATRR